MADIKVEIVYHAIMYMKYKGTMKSGESGWIRVREGDLQGVINPGLMPVLTGRFFDDLERHAAVNEGRVLKDSRVRWAATLPVWEGKTIFVKKFRILSGLQGFKHLIRSSGARREWLISRFLSQQGILTPKALGIIERRKHGILKESFFIAEALEGARDLVDFCKNRFRRSDQTEKKNEMLRLLAEKTREIHDIGLFQRDFHGGNFLVTDEGGMSLYFIDFHQARKQLKVSQAKRLWNIAQIFYVLGFLLDDEAKKLFLLAYGQGQVPFGGNLDSCLRQVEMMVQKIVKRRHKKLTKKCLKECTLFTIGRRASLKIYRRREMGEDHLMAILEAHREKVHSQRAKLLTYSPKTIVSMVSDITVNDRRVCVKEYRYETILDRLRNSFHEPEGKASWVAGNVLFNRGICPLKPLAYVERRKLGLLQEAFCVTESLADDIKEKNRIMIVGPIT